MQAVYIFYAATGLFLSGGLLLALRPVPVRVCARR